MHQVISVCLLMAVAFALNAKSAAIASSNGNWGWAVGNLFFGPLGFFFVSYTIIYFLTRALAGKGKVASYAASRLNYVAVTLAILGVIGGAASRGQG